MKRLVIAFVLAFSFSGLQAQNHVQNTSMDKSTFFDFKRLTNEALYSKTAVIDWYSPLMYDTVNNIHPTTYINFIQHDSLAKIYYADGSVGRNQWISFGRVLDPKDTNISISGTPSKQLSRYVGYTLDSIRFTYLYVRNVDSLPLISGGKKAAVDTLFICYFGGKNISRYSFKDVNNRFALVDWTGDSILFPRNYLRVDTVLLSNYDSTGVANTNGKYENYFNLKKFVRKVPSGINMNALNGANADNLIGYTVLFKSSAPTIYATDTAIMIYQKNPSTLPAGSHRTNYFGFSYGVNNDALNVRSNPDYYNTTLLSPTWAAYIPSNEWYGYVTGNAFAKELFVDAEFHLITDSFNMGVTDLSGRNFALNLFPNPVKKSQNVNLNFTFSELSIVKTNITDLTGKLIKMVTESKFESGEQLMKIDIADLNAGFYLLNIEVNGVKLTKKMMVTE